MQNGPTPRIAVLVPAYNAEKTIGKVLMSLKANAEPHDIFIVDDGSDIPLASVVDPAPNLTILRPEKNLGVPGALIYGMNYILERGYEYIAELDSDDAASPDRLAVERAFLDANPDVGMVGGWGRVVAEDGTFLFCLNHPTDHEQIKTDLFYNSTFIHSTMMFRASVLRQVGTYSTAFSGACPDYEMARRLAVKSKAVNLPKYLVDYTVSPNGISVKKRRRQLVNRLRIQWAYRDFANIHFYLGLLKSALLFYMPMGLIARLKTLLPAYRTRQA